MDSPGIIDENDLSALMTIKRQCLTLMPCGFIFVLDAIKSAQEAAKVNFITVSETTVILPVASCWLAGMGIITLHSEGNRQDSSSWLCLVCCEQVGLSSV